MALCIPLACSLFRFSSYREKTDPVEVVISQPNIDPYHDKFRGMSYDDQFDRLIAGFDSLGTPETRFFIGPETALHDVWENNPDRNWHVWSLKRFLNLNYPDAVAIVGASSYRQYQPDDALPESVRYRNDSSFIYTAHNSALFIRPREKVGIYHKSVLVSGVEKMPFQKFFRFLEPLILDLGGMTGTLGTQPKPTVFTHDGTIVGVPICYESGYGAYISGFVEKGANLLLVITNDGWWYNSPGYRQHLSFSRLRAVEFRRSVARCANTGISCLIDQRGMYLQKTRWWEQTAIRGSLNRNNARTLYARLGDVLGRIGVFLFVLMGLGALAEGLKNKGVGQGLIIHKKEPH